MSVFAESCSLSGDELSSLVTMDLSMYTLIDVLSYKSVTAAVRIEIWLQL